MNKSLKTLIEMHMYCRPMGSDIEQYFIDEYIANLPNAERDPYGNWHVTVDDAPVLWSSHLDTVHWKEGIQDVKYTKRSGLLTLPRDSKSSCLGADCTAGVFLMREMIFAKVSGHYVFHHGEEMGCIGSRDLAKHCEGFLSQFQFAIALDRGGTSDVITHQSYGRTASDAFALSLAKQLGGYYKPSDQGVYTDTNEYPDIIAECSNISVGYTRQHSASETLDTRHLFALLAKLKKLNVSKLVCKRKPGEGGYFEGGIFDTWWDDDRWKYLADGEARVSATTKKTDLKAVLRAERLRDQEEEDLAHFFREAEAQQRRYEGHLREEDPPLYVKEGESPAVVDGVYLDPEYEDVQKALRSTALKQFGSFWPDTTRKPS